MQVLNEDDIAISGFGGVRERVLLLDRQFFRHAIPDECQDGFGGCVYFANAQGLLTLSESGLLRTSFSQNKERGLILTG